MGRPKKTPDPVTVEEEETPLDKLQAFFSELAPGYRVQVFRNKPQEFRGLLEEYEINDGQEPLDLNYLLKTWGGKEIRLKVRNARGQFVRTVDIPLFSYPPLLWGKPLHGAAPGYDPAQPQPLPQQMQMQQPQALPIMPVQMQQPQPLPPTQQPQSQNLAELLGVLQKFRSSDTDLLTSLVQRSLVGPAPPAAPVDQWGQLNRMIETMARVQTLMPQAQPAQLSGDNEPDILPTITKLAELLLNKPGPQQPAPLIPPRDTRPQLQPLPAPIPTPPPPVATPPEELDGAEIVARIAGADPNAVARVMREALATMTPEKRAASIEAFEQEFEAVAPELFNDESGEDDTGEESKKLA